MIPINDQLSIPERDIAFTYARSPGPGGQNVNKVATKVTLWFDVAGSPSLTPSQRGRIQSKLATRIGRDGRLRVRCWRCRSQAANRRGALERFQALLGEALRPRKERKKTRPTRASRERRLLEKRRQSERKQGRRARFGADGD
ncbi:MAG: alternative ribosome rescue aminoacyl-tRNA hydrolase ArfB [Phycisphaerae bacterium]